jgi:hypothetical protein
LASDTLKSLGETWRDWNIDLPNIVSWILLCGFFVYLVFERAISKRRMPWALLLILWCALVVIAMRRIAPWSRVWLFLLPIYFMWASTGLSFLWHHVKLWNTGKVQFIFIASTMVVALLLGVNTIRSRSILLSDQTGSLRDAEEITHYLMKTLQPGDMVVALFPSDAPLQYYFRTHAVDENSLYHGNPLDRKCSKAYVVVNLTSGQSLDEVIDKNGLTGQFGLSTSRIVAQFATAQVIELARLP